MTSILFGRRGAVTAIRAAGILAIIVVGQLLSAHPASACDVGIGYKPTISFSLADGLGSPGVCSTGTSLTGVAILAVLAVALAAAVLKKLVDRGARTELAADEYLDSVGIPPTGKP
ncbi:hypothetical protein [Kineosporia succinea]|uniref:Uncharacterized protein n=1 Tax=Kineosporia succinea TaxID=84632 RepID=A0ABT9PBB4_9ACTN|nr:hypothetical protein [Kineosporia succinea]MDP9829310.1 hypothetical protein [Kineosporia succinea]